LEAKSSPHSMVVLSGCRIIDGLGSHVIENGVILIQDGIIEDLGEKDSVPIPKDSIAYDLKGKTVVPGLIDTHTHIQLFKGDSELDMIKDSVPFKTLKACHNAQLTLNAGFTGIRDLGSENLVDLAVRDACEQGLQEGPLMKVSAYKIMSTGADFPIYPPEVSLLGRQTMDGPDEVRKAVRTLLALGVDVIKIMTSGRTFRKSSSPNAYSLTLEEAQIVVDEAHNQGIPVSSHTHGAAGVKIALAAGCDTIEHGTVLDDADIELMIKNNTYLIPTFSYGKKLEQLGSDSGLPSYSISKALESRQLRLISFSKALSAGVNIAMGSDAGMPFVPHGNNAFELELMVEAGMTPMQAIMSATSEAAKVLRIDGDTGTIEKGKQADLLVVTNNPLIDIRQLQNRGQNIQAVIQRGRFVVNHGIAGIVATV